MHRLKRNLEMQVARLWLAAGYAQTGEVEEARRQIEQALPLQVPVRRQDPVHALLKAGLSQ